MIMHAKQYDQQRRRVLYVHKEAAMGTSETYCQHGDFSIPIVPKVINNMMQGIFGIAMMDANKGETLTIRNTVGTIIGVAKRCIKAGDEVNPLDLDRWRWEK